MAQNIQYESEASVVPPNQEVVKREKKIIKGLTVMKVRSKGKRAN